MFSGENTSGVMLVEDLAKLRSYDFPGGRVGSKTTRRRWLADAHAEPQGRHWQAAGPQEYLAALAALAEQIRAEDVLEAVEIVTVNGVPYLFDGHHRTFSAIDTDTETIPWVYLGEAPPPR